MARDIRIMGHLPEYYENIREFGQIAVTEDEEFKLIEEANAEDLADAFVMTASEKSIAIWESEIGIVPDKSSESLDFRKQRLINRYTMKPPFTIRWLEKQLTQLLGNDFIKVDRDDDVEILYVYVNLDSWPILKEFDKTIEAVLPLSMQYIKHLRKYVEALGNLYAGGFYRQHWHFELGKGNL